MHLTGWLWVAMTPHERHIHAEPDFARSSATASAAQHILPGGIRELKKSQTHLELQVESGDMAGMVELIRANKIDLALGVLPEGQNGLDLLPVFRDELMFVFGPSLLLIGDWHVVLLTVITASAGVTLLAAGLSGYFVGLANPVSRLLYVSAAFVLINPGLVTDTIGAALAGAGLVLNLLWTWQPRPARRRPAADMGHVEAPEHAPIEPSEVLETPARQAGRGDL